MRKRAVSIAMAIIMMAVMYYLARTVAFCTMSQKVGDKSRPVVVVDAGHGGDDPGKVGINGALEKDINLSIAEQLKVFLEQNDCEVILTRDSDEGLYNSESSSKKVEDLRNRMALIEASKPVLVVSIHQNSYGSESIHGAQVFYFQTSEEGKKCAQMIQRQLKDALDPDNNRQAKGNDSYYMLKKSSIPTIIVECGFLSNRQEAEKLTEENYQEKLAFHICLGIMKYLNDAENVL